ncbi:hypothetical protein CARUB_v10018213mg [Capsella rubella]|uniref:NYN domain-containing protein n=1 Tax=Capsella rubella TaxID=81985 RepID=R0FQS6_9BRAS|nr:uncharacterized protein LOC17886536 [Capsella rubella]EOA24922.1 hypothetical protein CARUB_v10018213mg [Capsella rubella]
MLLGGVPTGVFWDTVDCKISDDRSVAEVTQNIKKKLTEVGIDGTDVVSIRAYGDDDDDGKDHDFNSAGVSFTHSPAGERDARHDQIFSDVFSWVKENPAPANLVLFMDMGDPTDEFESIVIYLLMKSNYRYLLGLELP